MVLVRLGIGLFLIILFLPATPQDKAEVYASVEQTVESVNTFCDRNQTVCEVVRTLRGKVIYGVEMARELIRGRRDARMASGNEPSRGGGPTKLRREQASGRWSNTLTEHDRSYPWHDPNRM